MTEVIQMCGNMHSEASEPYKQYIFSRFNLQSVISFIFLSYPSMPQQRHSERYAVLSAKRTPSGAGICGKSYGGGLNQPTIIFS